MLYIIEQDLDDISKEELKAITCDKEIPEKHKVLEYLKSFGKTACTTARVVDLFTGEEQSFIDDARSDGVYLWRDSEIYHFEKYNLKLNDDFIEHVLNCK